MNSKLEIFAIYKLENTIKILATDGVNIFEMIAKKEDKKDIIIVNTGVLTEDRPMTPEELNANIYLAKSVISKFLSSNETGLDLRIKGESKDYDVEQSKYGYESCTISVYQPGEVTSEEELETLSTRQDYSKDYDAFIGEFEDEHLRSLRYYNKQRSDYIPWDKYFMAIAKLTSLRSKDPNTQVGACIVASDNRILSIGYNGAPLGIDDSLFPWDRSGANLHTKYMYVCHAELNAILNYRGSRKDFEGATIYVDLFPCNECAKMIIQAGIKKVVYLSDKYANTEGTIASKRLFDLAGVTYEPLNPDYHDTITLSLNPSDK